MQYHHKKSCLYVGSVFHARVHPKKHSFKYNVFCLNINLSELNEINKKFKLLSVNKFNIVSVYEKDYGPQNGKSLNVWVKELLSKNGVNQQLKNIFLLTYPRIFGYVFNPLSIYTCTNINNQVVAQIYEVRNTFKQRHFYIVRNTFDKKNHNKIIKKKFHVSPFLSMTGKYKFKSYIKKTKLSIFIEYFSNNETLIASFTGKEKILSDENIFFNVIKFPFFTIKIILGIHLEAIILYFKRLKYFKCPSPQKPNLSNNYEDN